jgi:choline-sulfatase
MKVFRTRIIAFSGLLLFGLNAWASTPKKAQEPDIFLVTIDTLRADHVHCYGYNRVKTPALDSLAKDGIRFAEAFTPSPITNSSHASILTGLLPQSHGVTDLAVPLPLAHPTAAELLKQHNYRTAAFIGAVILDSKDLAPGFDRGFDFYDNFPNPPTTKLRWGRLERRGMEVVRHAEDWLDRHPQGPHFVWLHLYDPHDPYEPPAPYLQEYKSHLYDGEIAYADSSLAHFIAYLQKTHRYRESIIVVVGDHGEGLGEHGEDTHGIFLYDSTLHVPLLIKLPGELHAGVAVTSQVRTIDILPTMLELAGAPALETTDGDSLQPYFAGASESTRPAFGATDYPLSFGWAPLRSVRTEEFKYIEAPRPEFYDLGADASELDNKYEPWNDRVQKARGMLAKLRAQESAPDSSVAIVKPETIDELTALGYVGPDDKETTTTAPQPSMLPDPKDKIEQQNLLHAAMIAEEDHRAEDARESLAKVLVLDPKSPIALRKLGELELQAGNYSQAAQHLKGALEAHPDDATASFAEGQAFAKLHDFPAAHDALETSLRLYPSQLPALLLLGDVDLHLENPTDAEDDFHAALLLKPKSVEAKLGLAKAEIAEHNFAEAVRSLEKLSRTEAENAAVFETLAIACTESGKLAEAKHAKARAQLIRQHAGDQPINKPN